MKSNELRLGNYIDLGNRIAKVVEIYTMSCTVVDLDETQDTLESYERTKPIPLTEEWLLKLGFKVTDGEIAGLPRKFQYTTWEKGNIDIDYFESRDKQELEYWFCYTFEGKNNEEIDVEIKHVHQLQNLYYALSGEELIIK